MSRDLPDLSHKRERASFIANVVVGGLLLLLNAGLLVYGALVL